MATPHHHRERSGLRGLLPAGYVPMEVLLQNAMEQLRSKSSDLEKYIFLHSLQDGCEDIYFAALMEHTEECMPLVYTPTVGHACVDWHKIFRHTPRGLYISINDKGFVHEAFENWPEHEIKVIVMTDGERILGLGDLGVNGMGIGIGKLALYTACAGVHPRHCLPIHIDVGTNNLELRSDNRYMGLRQERERGPDYDELVAEVVAEAKKRYGETTLIQFEDFGNCNAFRLLDAYKDNTVCFNDDIQGTAATALAGVLASSPLTGLDLTEHTFLFYGAGEAGCGIAHLLAAAIAEQLGVDQKEAMKNIWLIDSKGLVHAGRTDLVHHKQEFAHALPAHSDHANAPTTLVEAIELLQPTGLIGVSGQFEAFDQHTIQALMRNSPTPAPLVFALSNPTSKAECTAQQAYQWSEGKVVFASGSPMAGTTIKGRRLEPGQGNNAFIFPGLGLAAIAVGATRIDEASLLVCAKALAAQVCEEALELGSVYPPVRKIRDVAVELAVAVADHLHEVGLASLPYPPDMRAHVQSLMYNPISAFNDERRYQPKGQVVPMQYKWEEQGHQHAEEHW